MGGRLFGLFDHARFALALGADAFGTTLIPEALGFIIRCGIVFDKLLVKPAAEIASCGDGEFTMNLEIGLWDEIPDLLLTLDKDREGRGLDTADGRELETSLTGVHGGQRTGAVDSDEPVTLGAADSGRGERLHLRVIAQFCKALIDRLLGHRLQPEALHGLFAAGQLDDIVEDQFSFTAGVAGIDHRGDFGLLEQFLDHREAIRGTRNRLKLKLLGNDRQGLQLPREPLAARHLIRQAKLDQVTHRRGDDEVIDLEELSPARLPAKGPRQVGGDAWLLGDD